MRTCMTTFTSATSDNGLNDITGLSKPSAAESDRVACGWGARPGKSFVCSWRGLGEEKNSTADNTDHLAMSLRYRD